MAINNDNALLDVTGAFINQKFQEQSWFKENSNFITSAGGCVGCYSAVRG